MCWHGEAALAYEVRIRPHTRCRPESLVESHAHLVNTALQVARGRKQLGQTGFLFLNPLMVDGEKERA
jgi:hypothetical protein